MSVIELVSPFCTGTATGDENKNVREASSLMLHDFYGLLPDAEGYVYLPHTCSKARVELIYNLLKQQNKPCHATRYCGDGANYAVMVVRADNPFGPFTRLGEANGTGSSVILAKDSTWLAPGHNSIVKDKKGNRWIAYHAIWRNKQQRGKSIGRDHYVKRVMCIEPLQYVNGWPVIKMTY